jgi:hypothetical protein
MAYWCTFQNRDAACVLASNGEEASEIAERMTGELPTTVQSLPYAGSPILNPPSNGAPWAPCYRPEHCAGKKECPQQRECGNWG